MATTGTGGPGGDHARHAVFDNDAVRRRRADLRGCVQKQIRCWLSASYHFDRIDMSAEEPIEADHTKARANKREA